MFHYLNLVTSLLPYPSIAARAAVAARRLLSRACVRATKSVLYTFCLPSIQLRCAAFARVALRFPFGRISLQRTVTRGKSNPACRCRRQFPPERDVKRASAAEGNARVPKEKRRRNEIRRRAPTGKWPFQPQNVEASSRSSGPLAVQYRAWIPTCWFSLEDGSKSTLHNNFRWKEFSESGTNSENNKTRFIQTAFVCASACVAAQKI